MNKFLALPAILALLVLPIHANAANYGSGIGLHLTLGHHGGGHGKGYGKGHGRNYGHGNKHSNKGRHNNVQAYAGGSQGNHCRPTYKHVYDDYGNSTKINGTLCYDHYGQAYVVPGSRYVDNSYH